MDCGATKKRKRTNPNYGKTYHLSSLTDDLLVHILTFMPLIDVISTTKLSRRWRFLWTKMTTLNFEKYHNTSFINKALIFNTASKIHSFTVDINDHVSNGRGSQDSPIIVDEQSNQSAAAAATDKDFKSWVFFATSRSVQLLTLSAPSKTYPNALFTCDTVRDMKLSYGQLKLPSYISLSSLKWLTLSHIELGGGDVCRLTSGCRALKYLYLRNCNKNSCLKIYVTNPTLKKVVVLDRPRARGRVEINAPYLLVLKFKGNMRMINVINLRNIINLVFILDEQAHTYGLIGLVNSLRPTNVEIGRTFCIQNIFHESSQANPIQTKNTRYLHLMVEKHELRKAGMLVLYFRNLERLKISVLDNHVNGENPSYNKMKLLAAKRRWAIFGRHLAGTSLPFMKNITIDGIFDIAYFSHDYANEAFCMKNFSVKHAEEIELVKAFLQNFKALKGMNLKANKGVYYGRERQMLAIQTKVLNELLSFPRASPKLKIKFC